MLSWLLLIIIAGVVYFLLPFILTNVVILGIFVFLSRRKANWIVNGLLFYIAFNQFRKGIIVWGVAFLLIAILKSLNFYKFDKERHQNKKIKNEYKHKYREDLINKYIKNKKPEQNQYNQTNNDYISDDYVIDYNDSNNYNKRKQKKQNRRNSDDEFLDWFLMRNSYRPFQNRNQSNNINQNKNIITLSDRDKKGLFKQKKMAEREVSKELIEAYKRKEAREIKKSKELNIQNPNIPEDIYQITRTESDIKYKNALVNMYNDYESSLYTDKSNLQQVKDFYSGVGSDITDIFKDIFNKSKNEEHRFENTNQQTTNNDNDLNWIEHYDLDLNKSLDKGINVVSEYDFDYQTSMQNMINNDIQHVQDERKEYRRNMDRLNNEYQNQDNFDYNNYEVENKIVKKNLLNEDLNRKINRRHNPEMNWENRD